MSIGRRLAPAELGATGSREALPTGTTPTQAPVSIIEALANAIRRPGGKAGLLDADNQFRGWVSLAEAVQSGRAFFVDVVDDILAIDCDVPDLATQVHQIAADLRAQGCRPVLTESGQPGRLHLFCR